MRWRWPVDLLALLCVIVFALVIFYFSIRQHDSFHTHAFDMGYIDNVLWNTSQGRLFVNDFPDKPHNFLGEHFSPALIALAPLYWLWSDARVLFVAQSAALALSVLPCYCFVRRRYPRLALLVVIALLLQPALWAIALGEFHEIILAVPLLAWAFVALFDFRGRGQSIGLWVGLLGALLVKEEVAVIAATVGLYLVVAELIRRRRPSAEQLRGPGAATGAGLVVVALFWLGFVLEVLPRLLPDAVSHWQDRFGDIAPTPLQGVIRLVSDPAFTAGRFASAAKWQAVVRTLWPLALLPLLAPVIFSLALPVMGYLLLSGKASVSQLQFWYVAPLLPVLFVATAAAIGWSPRGRARILSILLVVASAAAYLLLGQGPLALQYEGARFDVNERTACGTRLLALIPADASLSAQDNLIPHLAHRRTLYVFPSLGEPPAEYVVLDARYEFAGGYSNWPVVRPLDVPRVVNQFLSNPAYDLIGDGCDYKVLRHAGAPQIANRRDVTFGQMARLLGYFVSVADDQGVFQPAPPLLRAGQSVRVILWWQAATRISRDYTVFVHALDSGGQLAGQHDSPPANGFRPSSQWAEQEVVRDIHYFVLSANAAEIEAGLYDGQTGERLVTTNAAAAVRFAVGH
jgi:uncharacterized membrane protein